jgi:hypothetical protein
LAAEFRARALTAVVNILAESSANIIPNIAFLFMCAGVIKLYLISVISFEETNNHENHVAISLYTYEPSKQYIRFEKQSSIERIVAA